jgi:hypothetical protein
MSVSKWLTRVYANQFQGEVVDEGIVSVNGVDQYVFYIESDGRTIAAQALPFLDIILNRELLDEFSEDVHDYAFFHEAGHKQWPFPRQLLFFVAQVVFLFFAVTAPVILLLLLSNVPWSEGIPTMISAILGSITALLVVILLLMLATWLDEGRAEVHAIRRMGPEKVESLRAEVRAKREYSRFGQLRRKLVYPPSGLTMAIGRELYKT